MGGHGLHKFFAASHELLRAAGLSEGDLARLVGLTIAEGEVLADGWGCTLRVVKTDPEPVLPPGVSTIIFGDREGRRINVAVTAGRISEVVGMG